MLTIELLRDQIAAARAYSTQLIGHVEPADWFRMPAEGVSHVAWQIGHLYVAQYRLAVLRVRGASREDAEFVGDEDVRIFGINSVAVADPGAYPPVSEIRERFDRVHRRVTEFIGTLDGSTLDEPLAQPHAIAKTRREVLSFCAMHEMLHAGQIGLLRRLSGGRPVR